MRFPKIRDVPRDECGNVTLASLEPSERMHCRELGLPGGRLGAPAEHLQLSLSLSTEPADDFEEFLDRREIVDRFDNAIEIQSNVLVDDDVAEPGKAFELSHEIRRKAFVANEVSDRPGVVLVSLSAPRGELTRDIDDELARREKGEKDIVGEREVPLETLPSFHPRTDGPQVIEMAPQLGESLDEIGHTFNASALPA